MKTIFIAIILIMASSIGTFATGVMIVNASQGVYFRLINSEVTVDVNNQVAMVVSKQKYVNNTGSSTVAKYGFPMPANATATQLRWKIGNTWHIAGFSATEQDTTLPGGGGTGTGPIQSLLDYLGSTPLYFSVSDTVDNNDTIEIEVTYVQLLEYRFNIVTFKYPSDYSLIQSGIIDEQQSLIFNLYSGRTIQSLSIEDYSANIINNGNYAELTYTEYENVSVDDYIVKYELASDELGVVSFSTFLPDSVQTCDTLGNGFLGLIIEPESNENTEVIEKVFTLIIDCSGSMSGTKIVQAKNAATFIVNNLNPGDYFNIVKFSTTVTSFQSEHVIFNAANQTSALAFISSITATGGTNISGALTTSIDQFASVDTTKANIIIFFTDGEATVGVTSTQGILDLVEDAVDANETNIFLYTFGIGYAANEQLLTLLALNNNGLSEFIINEDLDSVISDFYLTIRNPVLIGTQMTFSPDIIHDIYPDPLPNLYKGMQLILTGRYDVPQQLTITLEGMAFNQNVTYTYNIQLADSMIENVAFLPKLWAKNKIDHLTYLYYSLPENSSEADSLYEFIQDISLCYQVISAFTSFSDGGVTEIEDLFDEKEELSLCFSPNPFTSSTTVYINLSRIQEIVMEIFDVNGKLVKTIAVSGMPGDNTLLWDGTDMNQTIVGQGIYFYRITTEDNMYFGKLVKE